MRALRIASRNAGSSAASMVICVKKIMSLGSFASFSISSKRSARSPSRYMRCAGSARRAAILMSVSVTV